MVTSLLSRYPSSDVTSTANTTLPPDKSDLDLKRLDLEKEKLPSQHGVLS